MLSLAVDLAIVLLLVLVLGLGVLLQRRVSAMRADHARLKHLIDALARATERAEAALGELKRTAGEAAERAGQDLTRAQRLGDELRLLSDRADQLAERLAEGIRAGRGLARVAPAERPLPVPLEGAMPSAGPVRPTAAVDLERALRTLR